MKATTSLAVLAALAVTSPCLAHADEPPLAVQIVDALHNAFGLHQGFRANHAKGVVVEGTFTPSAEAASLSRALLFAGSTTPVIVRFSDSTGIPNLPDGSPAANPHGMAIKYHLPDGTDTDMVINSLKFFPVTTGEEFRDLLLAAAASSPGTSKPTALDRFAAAHPKVGPAFASATTPDSFADEEYNSIDAFVLVDKAGNRQAVRYRMVPEKLVHLDPAEAGKQPPDFLIDELPNRLKRGPVTFHLVAQLASSGDSTADPAQAWPAERKTVELGVLTIDKVAADNTEAQKALLFLPGQLTDGIEPSDDPLISLRDGAYAISFSQRTQ